MPGTGSFTGFSRRMAAAPFLIAEAIWSCPSAWIPGYATKRFPFLILRESYSIPVISGSESPDIERVAAPLMMEERLLLISWGG